MISQYLDIDIAKTIKIIEGLKSQLLSDVAQLYTNMAENTGNTKGENSDVLADIIIITYFLAKKMGITYDTIDIKVLNKLKLSIIEGKDMEYWLKDLTLLSRHIDKTRKIDRG